MNSLAFDILHAVFSLVYLRLLNRCDFGYKEELLRRGGWGKKAVARGCLFGCDFVFISDVSTGPPVETTFA